MRWVIRLGGVALAVLVLAGAALFLIPSEKVANLAAAEFSRATGRDLTFAGGVKPTLWPVLGVKTGAVSLGNAAWSDAGPMLQADALTIGLDMASLMGGTVRITEIVATGPQILLERNAKGQGNWEFSQTAAAGGDSAGGAPAPFTLDRAVITKGNLTFVDHASGARTVLSNLDLQAAIPAFDGPADLTLSAVMNEQPFSATVKVENFARFASGKLVPLTLASRIGGAEVALTGRAGFAPMMAEGSLTADLGDLAALARLAGQAAPALPQGYGRDNITLKGNVTLTEAGSVHLRGATLRLDARQFAGDADLTTDGPRPKLAAKLTTGALSLPPGEGGTAGTAAQGSGWSQDKIDASALGAMDADIALSAESVDLDTVKLGQTRMRITVDRARAVFAIKEAAAYQGKISGQFVINARNGLSVGGDLRFADLAMQPLLTDAAGYDRLIGTGDVTLKFLGVGDSLDAIMRSLSGDGRLGFGKGELRGLDIAGMLRTLDAGYIGEGAKTIFDKAALTFTLKDGVAFSDDLAIAAPVFSATAKGKLNLGAQTIDTRVMATALQGLAGDQGVTVPVLIKGPWADPKIKLDLEYLAQEKLDAERARLEARVEKERVRLEAEAKEKLARKAEKELGLVLKEGEDLEAAAKRRAAEALEAEAARALEKLLGGE